MERRSGFPACPTVFLLKTVQPCRGGNELDRFLRRFGYTIDPTDKTRQYAYHTDLAHYYPGKKGQGYGDIRPSREEIDQNRDWFERELSVIRPVAAVALGVSVADEFLNRYKGNRVKKLNDLPSAPIKSQINGLEVQFVAVHHPSGAFQHPSSARRYEEVAAHLRRLL